MKKLIITMLAGIMLFASCYKDKGNYDYNLPEKPVVKNIDSIYSVFIGDTLKVMPVVTFSNKAKLGYEWNISVPEELGSRIYSGPELKIPFGLGASRYNVRLSILDSIHEIKYFYDFIVSGKTAFSAGVTILTVDANKSKLCFVKPDGTIIQNVFGTINNRNLPDGGLQIISLNQNNYVGKPLTGYWITASQDDEGGVLVDPNTFKLLRTLRNNFFSPPATVKPGYLEGTVNGTLQGVINGKLYTGAYQTYYLSPIYGYFGLPADGDYEAFRKCLVNPSFPFYLGYDVTRKQFIGFTNFGSAAYIGTNYIVAGTAGFDPKNTGLDMVNIEQINATDGYAFGKGSDGILYELKYNMAFIGQIQMTPVYKRAFIRQDLIVSSTKWQVTPSSIFFFSSGDKIYRYNPLNDDIKPLTTNFEGKNVTMMKLADNGNTIIAGTEGTVYYLDVSVGKLGDVIKKITGIVGTPVDLTTR